MTRRSLTFLLIILLVLAFPLGIAAQQDESNINILVRFTNGGQPRQQFTAFEGTVRVRRVIRPLHLVNLQVPANKVDEVINALASRPDVLYVERDGIMKGTFVPNDPDYSTRQYAPQTMNMETAWNYTTGSGNVIIAVVDSGVSLDHPEFAGRVLPGYDFVNNDNDPSDDQGHGTHVAGIAAAGLNNGIGMAGICGNCKILPVKVLNNYNTGLWSDVAAGITYAADHGAKVINLSLGGTSDSQAVHDAVRYATEKGALVVAAAGNDGSNELFYPAAYTETVAVAATDYHDAHWSLSNYGNFIDVAAPGVAIYSTLWTADAGNSYGYKSGTSMAAPQVSGIAGLLFSQDGSRTNADVRQLLTSTADDLGDPGWDPYFGYGRVDGGRALAAGAGASLGSINGFTYSDPNGNGQRDANENSPVPDVTLHLLNAEGQVVDTTTSTADGTYHFDNVTAGNYQLDAEAPAGLYVTTPHPTDIIVGNGEDVTGVDFGLIAPTNVIVLAFQAYADSNGVQVSWSAIDDAFIEGYTLERSDRATGPWQVVTRLEPLMTDQYTVLDRKPPAEPSLWYRLVVNEGESQVVVGPVAVNGQVVTPTSFLPTVTR